MKNQSKMRWTKSDYITLGKAVSQFNKKINELNTEEKKLYLPEKINYKEIKENTITRNELNLILKSLKDFTKQGAEKLYTTQAGEQITVWEKQYLEKRKNIALSRLESYIKDENIKNLKSGYTKGQERKQEYENIKAQIKNLKQLENKKGVEFKRLKERIKSAGNLDYEYKMSLVYRENFMTSLGHAKNFEGYELLMKKFNKIKNPISFYNYIKNSDVFSDIFVYYKPGDGVIYGNFNSDEDRFNRGLEELGIVEEEKERIIKKLTNQNFKEKFIIKNSSEDYFNFLRSANSIESTEDLLIFLDFYKV